MKINILTLFPEMFSPITTDSILGKANEKGILQINIIDIRDYSLDKHRKVDYTPFGGGVGMLMACQPIFDALKSLGIDDNRKKIFYMSPRGKMLSKDIISSLLKEEEITILAGHYEGIDQRAIDYFGMEEISIGDYILTGGELPAMVLVDSLSRFIPGVLGNIESATDESIYSGLLESNQYTKPQVFNGMKVPKELTNGNHKEIKLYELYNSLEITRKNRPDLFNKWLQDNDIDSFSYLTKKEKKDLKNFIIKLKNN